MSNKVLIIGAGGVGRVVAYKCAQHRDVFGDIMLASRTKKKCDAIADSIYQAYGGRKIKTARLDADQVEQTIALLKKFQPDLVINVALPYQDLPIMDACLEMGVNYMDTANYEPKDVAKFEYSWQWAYQERYEKKGIMALLGCGFDPGVTSVYTAYAKKHYFDELHELDIVDANAGSHGKAFATNFNPEINIREVTQRGKYWENGQWIETEPHEIWKDIDYPEIGPKRSYLIFHEELESLVKHFPTLKRARFWMTFSEQYLTHLRVIQNIGMAGIEPVRFKGLDIVPLEFLKAVLPKPEELGENYTGFTSIGNRIKGIKDGKEATYYVWNNCSHVDAYRETGTQAVSYTTGVPAMIGARMILTGNWSGKGVFNVEQLNPDPFMERLNLDGLPWHEKHNLDLGM
ncbi:MAG: saccharopine dehydrogenase family protein [Saprospiraceae bacterium]|jgi:saccharopine dehydrogenase (NAD+, L-lysine-forming)|nr:saccharopine dehydrogenase family protein [Saprospiraceae bacterium]